MRKNINWSFAERRGKVLHLFAPFQKLWKLILYVFLLNSSVSAFFPQQDFTPKNLGPHFQKFATFS